MTQPSARALELAREALPCMWKGISSSPCVIPTEPVAFAACEHCIRHHAVAIVIDKAALDARESLLCALYSLGLLHRVK